MNTTPDQAIASWDLYWQGMRSGDGSVAGGTAESAIDAFWQEVFSAYPGSPDGVMLELACGSGDVTARALAAASVDWILCADVSVNALLTARKRHPRCAYVAFDAGAPSLRDGACDLVVSQFGVEYAGLAALSRAGELVAPGGVLAMVLHLRDGVIYQAYEQSLGILRDISASKVLPLVEKAFRAGFALHKGSGDRAALRRAEKRMTPALRSLESILAAHPPGVADGLPHRLYQDIAHMYPRLAAYDKADVIRWFRGMERELAAYEGRLRSMLGAALDSGTLDTLIENWREQGLQVQRREILNLGSAPAAGAWALVLARS